MFSRKPKETVLDKAIEDATRMLDPLDKDYEMRVKMLEKLHKLKDEERKSTRVSPDTILLVSANLTGIVLILHYEQLHVVASKALTLVHKLT